MDTDNTTATLTPATGTTVQGVQSSTNYDQFRFYDNNREVNRGHVEMLKKAIQENPQLTQAQPILVNDAMAVIDGQHRFTALKELEMPVHYVMVNGLNMADALAMNIMHKSWTVDDYLHYYAQGGNRNYQIFALLREEYAYSHSTILAYVYDSRKPSGAFKKFRTGDMVIGDLPSIKSKLDYLDEVNKRIDITVNKPLALAILQALNTEGFDRKAFLAKLDTDGTVFVNYGDVFGAMRAIESVYNSGRSAANRIRLF